MFHNKVQEILNQNHFADKAVYSVSGRAINEIIDAFAELQDEIRNEYENHIDDLRIELDFARMRSENLEERIEDLKLENSELMDELDYQKLSLEK